MPNWCYNRVTAYANDEHQDKLKEVEKIFESKTPFNDIFPMPDFKTTAQVITGRSAYVVQC